MAKARRRHVPAFGEWNYYYSSSSPDEPPELPRYGGDAAVDWWYVPDPDACSDVWFRYSPPPRKPPPKKARRRDAAGGGGVAAVATPAPEKRRYDGGGTKGRASDRVAKGGAARRVVRSVDEDLYQVPPPEFAAQRPRRKRSLWMGCFGGLKCVA
ncbi:hypothetical protein PR202_ga31158 [Eleusine coracana subsp. coracana]|uniref:Uncharacterized protein n=1 Tax=Eleusine coracana subsp. coracana TaxID=191504 RepID=A0AAV5DR97_ELECO|nr:hypothetical protein QOZ80_5AG0388350 [Eleusine coracana subsp. coracana]GJN12844.1 hypothetical protein PR202_ga31158 [Eleusine coracana subsp. coracana]